jgi:hypothetical protein
MDTAMIPHDQDNTKADAWRVTADVLERRHPGFPLAGEVARRIADHHEARLPLGWESVPIMNGDEP